MIKKKITRVIIGACLVLLVPLLAMGVSDEVQWNWFDFAVIGFLLVSAGLLYELLAHWLTAKYRPIAAPRQSHRSTRGWDGRSCRHAISPAARQRHRE